jgi:hypothetical protein
MPKKSKTRWHFAPLQHIIGEIVTDPAELAAVDERRRKDRARKLRRSKLARQKRAKAQATVRD